MACSSRAGARIPSCSARTASGQLLAARLLGRESISIDPALRILKASAKGFEDRHPADLEIRERTDTTVLGVERNDEIQVVLGPDFRFQKDDVVYICGSDEATQLYEETFLEK